MLKHELTRKKPSEEKAEVLNAFFTSVIISNKTNFWGGTQPTELEDKGKEQNEFLTILGK